MYSFLSIDQANDGNFKTIGSIKLEVISRIIDVSFKAKAVLKLHDLSHTPLVHSLGDGKQHKLNIANLVGMFKLEIVHHDEDLFHINLFSPKVWELDVQRM